MAGIIGIILGVGLHYLHLPIAKKNVFRLFMYFLQGGFGLGI